MVLPKVIGHTIKRLPPSATDYFITEFKLFRLHVNISLLEHLLAKVHFECTVEHLAVTYIMEGKIELASTRFKRLLDSTLAYSFNLY